MMNNLTHVCPDNRKTIIKLALGVDYQCPFCDWGCKSRTGYPDPYIELVVD